MQGIGPGTILSGRYTAEHRTAAYPGAEQWTARDSTLDRTVVLLAVGREHPNVDAVLDAARRSAGLDNVRLSRILDVGTDDGIAYVVEEALEGSQTISQLLAVGPLPAPEVRRIVGETSLVLDVARHRGLHHQRLTPDLVLRTPDGDVKVRGLATMAALAGVDHVPDQEAAHTDAIAVVALAYAGFTATWPLPGPSGGLPPAPRVAGQVAAPSELSAGVPADLDALCRLTFANNQGPLTPGDFARQIAPWSPIPVMLASITSQTPRHESPGEEGPSAASPEELDETTPAELVPPRSPQRPERSLQQPAQGLQQQGQGLQQQGQGLQQQGPRQSGSQQPDRPPVKGPVPVAHRIPSPAAPAGPGGQRPAARDQGPTARVQGPTPGDARPGARNQGPTARVQRPSARDARPAAGGAGPASPQSPQSPQPPTEPGATLGPSPVATSAAKTAAALGAAGAATASAAKSISERFSGWSSDTRDKARLKVEELKERREEAATQRTAEAREAREDELDGSGHEEGSGAYTAGDLETAGAGRVAHGRDDYDDDRLEPPIPLLPPSAADPLTRDQSRLAIGIIVGFLVIAFAFAVWGLSRLPSSLPGLSSSDGSTSISTPEPEVAESTDAPADDGTVAGPGAPAPGQSLEFSAAADYDPLGDGSERPEELALILDGDESTFWGSEGYRNSTFSNIKAGVGVILDLGAESSLSAVDLVLPSAASGELYVTSDEAFFANKPTLPDDWEPAGTFTGEGSVTTELAEGTRGRYVVVWYTEISRQGDWYRARLAEAGATS